MLPNDSSIFRLVCVLVLGTSLVLLSACDSSGPSASLESNFDLTIGAPVNKSVKGTAALGADLSFEEQSVFTLPAGPFGKTMTIIQLSGESEQGHVHDLSFIRLADESIEEGTYEVNKPFCQENGEDCEVGAFPPEELFTADYGRQTADSLHFHPIDEGTVTVETANDEGVKGTFSLSSSQEISVSRAEMEAYIDSMRAYIDGDTVSRPTPPPASIQDLASPLPIEGRFTATNDKPLSKQVPHLGGFGRGVDSDTIVIGR